MIKELKIKTEKQQELIDITGQVKEVIQNVKNGTCTLFCQHTTAAITINENADPHVKEDIITQLNRLAPPNNDYKHREGNADAHIKSSLIGCSETIIIENSTLQLGTWQAVMFCEFDGPRDRKLVVQVND